MREFQGKLWVETGVWEEKCNENKRIRALVVRMIDFAERTGYRGLAEDYRAMVHKELGKFT